MTLRLDRMTKQELVDFVVAHRDAGTLAGKLHSKVRKHAFHMFHMTSKGEMYDLDWLWIAAGCPKTKLSPFEWLTRQIN